MKILSRIGREIGSPFVPVRPGGGRRAGAARRATGAVTEFLERRVFLSAAPVATLQADDVITSGNTIQSFEVVYTDPVASISAASVGTGNVTVTAPDGSHLTVAYATTNDANGGTVTAVYSVNAPGGTFVPASVFNGTGSAVPVSAAAGQQQPFTAADNGTYTVSVNPNSVLDFSGNAVPAGPIGTFNVNVSSQPAVTTPFQHVVIDPNPGSLPVDKALIDARSDGHLDPVIGHNDGTGLYWYEPQSWSNPSGPWVQHTIVDSGYVYEDLQVADVNGDGAVDLVASVGNKMYWFENPAGSGGDPAQPWAAHYIGDGLGHNFTLADLDRDGKLDVVTQRAIYFQNNPDSWTQVDAPQIGIGSSNGVAVFDATGSGNMDIAAVSGDPGHPLAWYQNPLDTGGNPRTDAWQEHVIGPGYAAAGDSVSFAAGDFTGDGRIDLVTAPSERDHGIPYAPGGGLILWVAPADPVNGTWTPVTLDSSYTDVHKIDVADIDGDGSPDLVVAEQEQSVNQRIAVFHNVGGQGQDWQQQVIATTGEQNIRVGDMLDDGRLSIFGANHGFFGANHPVEAWLQQGPAVTSTPAPPSALTAYAYSGSTVTLSWQDNSTVLDGFQNALGFAIERSTNGTNFQQVARVGEGTTLYIDSRLQPDTTYYYRVAAIDASGNSAWSGVASAQTGTGETVPPGATVATPPNPAIGAAALPITVTYTDASGIDPSSINVDDISVTGPAGALRVTGFSIAPPGTGSPLVVTYMVAAPTGAFIAADNGTYHVAVNAQTVFDLNGNAVPANAGAMDFQVALVPDTNPPTAVVGGQPTLGTEGQTETFTVTYDDAVAIDAATVGTDNIVVTGPGGQTLAVESATAGGGNDGPSLSVAYAVVEPNGMAWTSADNGTFTVSAAAGGGAVTNVGGVALPAGPIGTFQVAIPAPPSPTPTPAAPLPPSDDRTLIGRFESTAHRAGRITFLTSQGSTVTLTLTDGSASAFWDTGGQLDLVVQSDEKGAGLTVDVRGGDRQAVLGDVRVAGTLKSFVAPTTDLAGTLWTSGAIGRLSVAQITGTVAAAGPIGTVAAGAITGAKVLSGASLADNASLAGATFGPGAIGSVAVSGKITDTIIAAGVGTGPDGTFGDADDADFGGTIASIAARGGADARSLFLADRFGHATLPRHINVRRDGRFKAV